MECNGGREWYGMVCTYLPEEKVAEAFDAAGADEDVKRWGATFGGHEVGVDVFLCYGTEEERHQC